MSNLIKRVEGTSKTHLHNIMQIAVFHLNDSNFYGINVSKIRSFEDKSRYEITKNNAISSPFLEGFIQYQGKVIPIVSIEKWLGIYEPHHTFLIYLVCEFNKKMVCFPICHIDNIYNVEISKLQKPDSYFEKIITYNALIEIQGQEEACLVLDVERLLFETFDETYATSDGAMIDSDKMLLIAEDSKTATEIIHRLLENQSVPTRYFKDGQEIIEHLDSLSPAEIADVGLVITDLEMPRKDGYQVIMHIKQNPKYDAIPVLVNSSMSNLGVNLKTEQLGVEGFIAKTDPDRFIHQIKKFIRR